MSDDTDDKERERQRCKRIAENLDAVARLFWAAHYAPYEMTAEKWQAARPTINAVIRDLVEEFV